MEEKLAAFLFLHKHCPLPGLGSLRIIETSAKAGTQQSIINPPEFKIEYNSGEVPVADCLRFLMQETDSSETESSKWLSDFTQQIRNLQAEEEQSFAAGTFLINAEGILSFNSHHYPEAFAPPVSLPKSSQSQPSVHEIRVGDTYTTNAEMTAFLNRRKQPAKNLWWPWAVGLFFIAICLIIIYFVQHSHEKRFGNYNRVDAKDARPTYRISR